MQNGNRKYCYILIIFYLPQLEVKTMEPQSINNATTSVKKSQTLILTKDRDDGTLVHFTLIVGVYVSLGNGYERVKPAWSRTVTNPQAGKLKSKTLRRKSFTIIHAKLKFSPLTDHGRREAKGATGRP